MADERMFRLNIICPDRSFYEGEASMIELRTTEGEVGIYKDHIPMTMIIAPGIIKITGANGIKKAALHAGFLEVLPEEIMIMAEIAEWPEEIDVRRAEEARIRAERRISQKEARVNLLRAEIALKKALVRMELGQK